MSITIRDCLRLPSLSLGTVVAGHKGLDSIVTTVSVVEFEDNDEPDIVSPNELLISSLYCVKDDADAQCKLIDKAKRSGDVGLVLFYADEILGGISPKLLKVADLLQFPIILMPGADMGLKYSDVISDVMEAAFMDRNTNNYFVRDTIQRLSQSEEKDRTPSMVLQLASSYAKAAFFLCDEQENLIASSFWPASNHLSFSKVLHAYHNNREHKARIFRTDFVDKKDAKLVLYAVSQNTKLNASMIGEVIEVIQIFSLLWNYNLNLQMEESVLPPLLEGDKKLVRYISQHNQIHIANYNHICILSGLEERQEILVHLRRLFSEHNIPAIIDRFGQYTVMLYQRKNDVTADILEQELYTYLRNCGQTVHDATLQSLRLIEDAPHFYQMFCQYMDTVKQIYPRKRSFSYSDLLFAKKVSQIQASIDFDSHYYLDLLTPIIEDAESELLPTLLTYLLDSGSEVKRTAELLYVHRNTVLYRLNKARSLLHCDLNKMPQAYDIYLAAALQRLQYVDSI